MRGSGSSKLVSRKLCVHTIPKRIPTGANARKPAYTVTQLHVCAHACARKCASVSRMIAGCNLNNAMATVEQCGGFVDTNAVLQHVHNCDSLCGHAVYIACQPTRPCIAAKRSQCDAGIPASW